MLFSSFMIDNVIKVAGENFALVSKEDWQEMCSYAS
jgi:hypothetical protein